MYHFGQTPYPYPIPYPYLPYPYLPTPYPYPTPNPYTYPYPLHLPLPMDQSEYFCFGKTGKSEVGRLPSYAQLFCQNAFKVFKKESNSLKRGFK